MNFCSFLLISGPSFPFSARITINFPTNYRNIAGLYNYCSFLINKRGIYVILFILYLKFVGQSTQMVPPGKSSRRGNIKKFLSTAVFFFSPSGVTFLPQKKTSLRLSLSFLVLFIMCWYVMKNFSSL